MISLANGDHRNEEAVSWAWTVDRLPLTMLVIAAMGYAALAVRADRSRRRAVPSRMGSAPARNLPGLPVGRIVAWYTGLGVIAVALFSPLDPYGEERAVSAHMIQHELLLTVAPVLLVAGLDQRITLPITRTVVTPAARTSAGRGVLTVLNHPVFATTVWVAAMLGWHLPAAYDAALDHDRVHVLQHSSLLTAGVVFWIVVIGRLPSVHRTTVRQRIAALCVAMAASGILGAVMIWSNSVMYSRYAHTQPWFGLSPVQDQRLAGAVMMAVDMPVLLGALGWVVARWARRHPTGPPRDLSAAHVRLTDGI